MSTIVSPYGKLIYLTQAEIEHDPKYKVGQKVSFESGDTNFMATVIGPSFIVPRVEDTWQPLVYPVEVAGDGFWKKDIQVNRICVLGCLLTKVE